MKKLLLIIGLGIFLGVLYYGYSLYQVDEPYKGAFEVKAAPNGLMYKFDKLTEFYNKDTGGLENVTIAVKIIDEFGVFYPCSPATSPDSETICEGAIYFYDLNPIEIQESLLDVRNLQSVVEDKTAEFLFKEEKRLIAKNQTRNPYPPNSSDGRSTGATISDTAVQNKLNILKGK